MSDLALTIYNAVQTLQKSISSLILDGTMTITASGEYDVSTGSSTSTTNSYPVKVVKDQYKAVDLINTNINVSDVKLIVFNNGVTPVVGAVIAVGSESFMVINVSKVTAGTYDLVFELQCRK